MAKKATPKAAKPKAAGPTATLADTMRQLEALGDAGVRAQNAKSGAGDNQFGVKRGDLRTLANTLKTNHDLALELWSTGNADAQLLATLVLDVRRLSADELERMVRGIAFAWVADWLHSYVIKEHADKEALREKWMHATDRWSARAGWQLTAGRVAKTPDGLDLVALLDRIEKEMATAAPEVQWTMNACLAEIGIHFPKHRKRALAIGEALGVYRDYPCSKGCTSPFAPIWITEMVRRQG
jgi:3-methyladenine DNA glycosylase AlkD